MVVCGRYAAGNDWHQALRNDLCADTVVKAGRAAE
jgi:hypothetical protein